MTPMTIARPTMVRTSPPEDEPAVSVALALASVRLSGVFSPSAARAAGARRSRPRTATPADLKAGVSGITEEGASLDQDSTPSSAARAAALVDVAAAVHEQGGGEEHRGPRDQDEHRRAPGEIARIGAARDARGRQRRVVRQVLVDEPEHGREDEQPDEGADHPGDLVAHEHADGDAQGR